MNITTEHTFETALVQSLTEHGGYTQGNAPDYIYQTEAIRSYEYRTALISEVVTGTIKTIDW